MPSLSLGVELEFLYSIKHGYKKKSGDFDYAWCRLDVMVSIHQKASLYRAVIGGQVVCMSGL